MDSCAEEHQSLGFKHKKYNEMLNKALKDEVMIKLENINFDKSDQDNLLMIDIANKKRDVEYILNVLKSEDMLYVSRALQKCIWLITDNQYAHIINPQHLDEHLLPQMTTKAGNKLIKHIRKHLIDETRAEQFYLHEKKDKVAIKWLPKCSTSFIEENVEKHIDILQPKLLKRLCEKSFKVFEIVVNENYYKAFSKCAKFLLGTHTEEYLDVLDNKTEGSYAISEMNFNGKSTALLMKKTPDRILNNFEKYVNYLDIATFAKHIEKESIQDFLLKLANRDDLPYSNNYYLRAFLASSDIAYLIKRIPKEQRFDFVKKVFIDNIEQEETMPLDPLICRMQKLAEVVRLEVHQWYQFAPFDIAFEEIIQMIKVEKDHEKKYSMLYTLIACIGKSEKNLQTLLKYYVANHINDEDRLKNEFIGNLIKETQVYKYDKKSWELLNEIFKNMAVYVDKVHDVQNCIILLIIYHSLNNEVVPDIIVKKFSFDTLIYYCNKMNNDEQEKVFKFLYDYLLTKIKNQSINTESELTETKETLETILNLFKDWKKELIDYPFVLNKIKDIIKIKKENSWKTNLSTLYNLEKTWRKHLFEQSLVLHPSQEACMNALKHNPELLLRYSENVKQLCCDDNISMRQLLSKIRIYWPESLAIDWANAYRNRLNVLGGHKALIRGLCGLVPENSLVDIIERYAPKEAKINWKNIDELTLSLQRHIAKNMHLARPQIDPNAVLWYAKGDYLQYALPSVLAVFYNMKTDLSREFVPKLLDAPVSVQKHGIRFAFLRLEPTELKPIFLNIWNNSKNISIRAELFKYTFKLLCNSNEESKVEEIWNLLKLFIDNLAHTDEAKIFDLLVRINDVPTAVRPEYIMICYKTIKSLLHRFNADRLETCKRYMRTLAESSRDVMQCIDNDFIVEVIGDYLTSELFNFEGNKASRVNNYSGMLKVISAYLLCTNDIEQQRQRYEATLAPIIKRMVNMETNKRRESQNLENLSALLHTIYKDVNEYAMKNNFIIPYKMFHDIQHELESLPIPENYKMVTMWKLITLFTKLLSETDTACEWDEVTTKLAPEFANICSNYLKQEVITRFSCIYIIFSRALKQILDEMPYDATHEIYKKLLEEKEFVQAYLAVINMLPVYTFQCWNKEQYDEIHKLIKVQSLPEIKMHYYSRFQKHLEYGC